MVISNKKYLSETSLKESPSKRLIMKIPNGSITLDKLGHDAKSIILLDRSIEEAESIVDYMDSLIKSVIGDFEATDEEIIAVGKAVFS